MSYIIRCDAPGCTEQIPAPTGLPAGWRQSSNQSGHPVHAHSDAHLTAAAATTGDPKQTAIAS